MLAGAFDYKYMSDNKKWFKTWTSILTDHSHINMSCQQVGQWTRLCAHLASSGERGKLKITSHATHFFLDMETTWENIKSTLNTLPNVHIIDMNSANGEFIVTLKNWYKYQIDSTVAERVSRLRSKRRREETSKSTSTSTPSASRSASLGAPPPLAENGGKNQEVDAEELEQQEANKAWRQNTNKSLTASGPKVATPEEVSEILSKWRMSNPRGGKH
jgi:hypothetical protein